MSAFFLSSSLCFFGEILDYVSAFVPLYSAVVKCRGDSAVVIILIVLSTHFERLCVLPYSRFSSSSHIFIQFVAY